MLSNVDSFIAELKAITEGRDMTILVMNRETENFHEVMNIRKYKDDEGNNFIVIKPDTRPFIL